MAYVTNCYTPALLLRWISSFLRDKTVKVRILSHTSWEIAINYGVRQGSPISPLLFLLYMSKLPKLLPNIRRSLDLTSSNLTFKPLWMTWPYLTTIIVSSLKGKRATGSNHKTSLITVRSSLLRHLLCSLVLPLILLSLPYCRHSCPSSPP